LQSYSDSDLLSRKEGQVKAVRLFIAALLLVAAGSCWQAAYGQLVIGRYAGEFLSLGAGARALAMGGASVAAPTPSTASYYNPSALAGVQHRFAEFMHASQFDNLYTYDYLSFAAPMRSGYAGSITALYTRVTDIPVTRLADPSQPLSDNNPVLLDHKTGDHELALMAGVGRQLPSGWRAGANAKLLFKTVAGESAEGLGVDLGVGRTVAKGVDIGLMARDLTTSILAWSTGRTEAILPSLVVGGAWSQDLSSLNARITATGDLNGHFESRGDAEKVHAGPLSVQPQAGLEYLISNTVALRGGYNGDAFTAGAGIHLAWMNVNAAFQNHTDLGFTHRVSVAVTW
jgi:hypothetical protein